MRLLLETHITPAVRSELQRLAPGTDVELLQQWRGGALRTAADDDILTAALEDGYVFVTFDVTTIPPLLTRRYERGDESPGVILVSTRTLRPSDAGAVARALAALCHAHGGDEWTGRVMYLAGIQP